MIPPSIMRIPRSVHIQDEHQVSLISHLSSLSSLFALLFCSFHLVLVDLTKSVIFDFFLKGAFFDESYTYSDKIVVVPAHLLLKAFESSKLNKQFKEM
jgi:hypothetical protein